MTHDESSTIPEYPNTVDVVPMDTQCASPALHMVAVSRHRRPYAGRRWTNFSA